MEGVSTGQRACTSPIARLLPMGRGGQGLAAPGRLGVLKVHGYSPPAANSTPCARRFAAISQ